MSHRELLSLKAWAIVPIGSLLLSLALVLAMPSPASANYTCDYTCDPSCQCCFDDCVCEP
jgi:hypothetical protein